MRIANKMILGGALALSLGAVSSPAGATLIFDSVHDLTGTGLGNVNTVLTIQSPGSNTTEQGCVGRIAGCPGGTASTTPSDPARVIGGTLGGNELPAMRRPRRFSEAPLERHRPAIFASSLIHKSREPRLSKILL